MRGISVVDGWAHNPEVVGSSPTLRNQFCASSLSMKTIGFHINSLVVVIVMITITKTE